MPSGAKKRKAAKKKKVNNNINSSTTNSHQGENDSGELSSPVSQDNNNNVQDPSTGNEGVEVVKREDNSSESKAIDVNEEEGNIEIKSKSSNGSSSSSSDSSDEESHVVEKNVVVLESVPETESLPEKISRIEDPIKPDELLLEPVKKVYDETKSEVKKELVVEEQMVVDNEISSKDDCPPTSSVVIESIPKEDNVVESPSVDEEASLESKDSISEVKGGECANEGDTIEYSDRVRQPVVASTPLTVQKTTSWKGCCGLFELFSGSER